MNSKFFQILVIIVVLLWRPVIFAAHPLIPEDYQSISETRLKEGVIQADKFRRELLRQGASGRRQIDLLARACIQFGEQMSNRTDGFESLDGFKIKERLFLKALEGDSRAKRWARVFDGFQGEWFGKWDEMLVDHRWFPSVSFDSRLRIDGFHDVFIRDGQFAWVGDGFGWNIIASETADINKGFVLGSVYHVQGGDLLQVQEHRPHVGIICGDRRLIWITRGEVFFEERFKGSGKLADRYVITGFRYQISGGRVTNSGNAFQAIYTRDRNQRPNWKEIWVGISAE